MLNKKKVTMYKPYYRTTDIMNMSIDYVFEDEFYYFVHEDDGDEHNNACHVIDKSSKEVVAVCYYMELFVFFDELKEISPEELKRRLRA